MKDLVGGVSGSIHIWIKDEYAKFIKILNRPEMKKKVFLRLTNIEEEQDS